MIYFNPLWVIKMKLRYLRPRHYLFLFNLYNCNHGNKGNHNIMGLEEICSNSIS